MKFSDLGLQPDLLRGVEDLGFSEPTPIQRSAVPPALEGRDVLACAMTGSGKTAAFVLPLLQRLAAGRRNGTRALILTPTRELAAQVHEHLESLGRHTGIRAVTVFGGVNARPQEKALRAGVDVVVATPGRLLDHMGQGNVRFEGLEVLVLDEADRMLDMGFLPDVKRILSALPRERQTLLFSATLPRPIVELSRQMLVDPARLDVERPSAPATGVTQEILPVAGNLKPHLLLHLIQRGELETALVFTRTKHRANRLAAFLDKAGISCERIHGNRSQKQRELALAGFKDGSLQVLVATDIAARGIDIEALPHVVNFDVPNQAEDYIHRVGRTARARSTGHAMTFASPEENGELAAIERAVGKRLARRQVEGFDYAKKPEARFEIPIQERIAEIRARKAEERARARAKAERRAANEAGGGQGGGRSQGTGGGRGSRRGQGGGREANAGQGAGRQQGRTQGAGRGRSAGGGRASHDARPQHDGRRGHDARASHDARQGHDARLDHDARQPEGLLPQERTMRSPRGKRGRRPDMGRPGTRQERDSHRGSR